MATIPVSWDFRRFTGLHTCHCMDPMDKAVARNLLAQVEGIRAGIKSRPFVSPEVGQAAMEFWDHAVIMLKSIIDTQECE